MLSEVPPRIAYYPGAPELFERFISSHPQAQSCGEAVDGALPWTLIPDIDPANTDDICFSTESFCPILAATKLEAPSPAVFVSRAVEFANKTLWGTLTACIIVHPESLRDPVLREAIEDAVERLRYGVIAVNCLPGLVWALSVPPWGSYPGNKPWDIQSGVGFIHNAYMFSRVQKTVIRAPFRAWPRPPWFPSKGAGMAEVCRRVAAYEAQPSLGRMLRIVVAALR